MNKNLAIMFGFVFILAFCGAIYAANEKNAMESFDDTQQEKNMTYGQCVSENAVIKNSCYSNVKEALNNCKLQAEQESSKKDAVKSCKQTYKKDKKECKNIFKASKNECKKIKHNFLETLGSAFK